MKHRRSLGEKLAPCYVTRVCYTEKTCLRIFDH